MSMLVITRRQVIKSVPHRWREIYATGKYGYDKLEILAKLDSMDTSVCTSEDIAKVIGNDGWASLRCDGCGQEQDKILHIGEGSDYESRWQDLCIVCLAKAFKTLMHNPCDESGQASEIGITSDRQSHKVQIDG